MLIKNIPGKKYLIKYPCTETYTCSPIELNIDKGTYIFELWGAGSEISGGYVRGEIHLYDKTTSFFLYIGGVAPTDSDKCGLGGYNGGGSSDVIGASGSTKLACRSIGRNGATDIRINETLESRILVAGGSGGGRTNFNGGFGGGFVGGNGNFSTKNNTDEKIQGGNQFEGGSGYLPGSFGIGGNTTVSTSTDLSGGGGGGWFGGGSGYHYDDYSTSGGGSSFINGNPECNVTSMKYKFYNSYTLSGNETMPHPTKSNGHYLGNGFARITCIDPIITCQQNNLKLIFSTY